MLFRSVNQLRSMLSRRKFLGAAGAIGAGVALSGSLAACGTKSDKRAYDFPNDMSDSEKLVRWANWPLYLDVDFP